MKLKTLTAVAAVATAAAAFAIPLAQAGGDKAKDASASQGASSSGAEKMFQALHKNNDGRLSREEHAAAPEHAGEKAAAGGTSANRKY